MIQPANKYTCIIAQLIAKHIHWHIIDTKTAFFFPLLQSFWTYLATISSTYCFLTQLILSLSTQNLTELQAHGWIKKLCLNINFIYGTLFMEKSIITKAITIYVHACYSEDRLDTLFTNLAHPGCCLYSLNKVGGVKHGILGQQQTLKS